MQNHSITKFAEQDRRLRRVEAMARAFNSAPARVVGGRNSNVILGNNHNDRESPAVL